MFIVSQVLLFNVQKKICKNFPVDSHSLFPLITLFYNDIPCMCSLSALAGPTESPVSTIKRYSSHRCDSFMAWSFAC